MDRETISRSEPADFKLGDWWVRPQRNELERADDTVHVEARSMAVLVCLAHHAPGVVTKKRLFAEVWSDSPYVGDDVISHAIWELRKALGDSARSPSYILTVPRKGYRLVAEVLRPQGSPLPMEGVRIGHYDLGEEIGRGSMGVVYRAEDRRLGRTVAIKFLAPELTRDPKACRRFEREARLAASLDHPNLGTVHEVGETSGGHRYLVHAFYVGGSLKDRLATGAIDTAEALRLTRQLVAGLAAAHQRDIVHRDIKPANLLLDEHGTLKICDFGIAKLLGGTDLTHTGAPLGTPAYKSPEQAQGHTVDHRTDLWAAGVVFYELLTGRRPFDGEYEQAVVRSIFARAPRALEGPRGQPLPETLRAFIEKALDKDPAQRFQSAEEMGLALDKAERGEPRFATPRRKRWIVLAAGILAALLGSMLWSTDFLPSSLFSIPDFSSNLSRRSAVTLSEPDPAGDPELLLFQGRKDWLAGNHPENLAEVLRKLELVVRTDPSSADAVGHLAVFLAERYFIDKSPEKRRRALELAETLAALDSASPLDRVARARIELTDGNLAAAERLAREAIEIWPTCDRDDLCDLAYRCLVDLHWLQGRFSDAWSVLDVCEETGGGYIRCTLKKAQLHEHQGNLDEAKRQYLKVLELSANQTTALSDYALLLLENEQERESIEIYNQLLRFTTDPIAFNNKGNALYARRRWSDAMDAYRAAHDGFTEQGRKVPTPLVNMGDIEVERGNPEAARGYYRSALEVFESIEDPRVIRQGQMLVCLAKLGRFDEAEAGMARILDQATQFPQLLKYRAILLALQGRRAELLEAVAAGRQAGLLPADFLDDPAFLPYREDEEYLRVVEPEASLFINPR